MSMTESAFEFIPENPVTSPELPAQKGIVHTPKQFSDTLTLDLTDEEIQQALQALMQVIRKWQRIFREKIDPRSIRTYRDVEEILKDVDKFESEVKERMAAQHILASVDVMGVLQGESYPTIVIEGALPSHSSAKYGMDHEKKEKQVKLAASRGEAFLGEKYPINSTPAKRRAKDSGSS